MQTISTDEATSPQHQLYLREVATRTALRSAVTAALIDRSDLLGTDLSPASVRSKFATPTLLDSLWSHAQSSEFEKLVEPLPMLIRSAHLRGADGELRGHDSEPDWALLSDVYQLTSAVVLQIGGADLALIAADRAISSGERLRDIVRIVAGYYRTCLAYLQKGESDAVFAAARVAKILMERERSNDQERLSLRGSLELCRAIASCEMGEQNDAFASIREAYQIAASVPADLNVAHTEFCHANVAVHEVTVLVKFGMAKEAIAVADGVDRSSLSAERRTRFNEVCSTAHALHLAENG